MSEASACSSSTASKTCSELFRSLNSNNILKPSQTLMRLMHFTKRKASPELLPGSKGLQSSAWLNRAQISQEIWTIEIQSFLLLALASMRHPLASQMNSSEQAGLLILLAEYTTATSGRGSVLRLLSCNPSLSSAGARIHAVAQSKWSRPIITASVSRKGGDLSCHIVLLRSVALPASMRSISLTISSRDWPAGNYWSKPRSRTRQWIRCPGWNSSNRAKPVVTW
jgi:hypothetical protein